MLRNLYLFIAIAVCGAAVFALEILGMRILAPFYGVTIFLSSCLIAMVIGALSLGHIVAGFRADKKSTYSHISLFTAISGIWIALIPFISHPVLSMVEPHGFRIAITLAAFVLFFLPCMFLGMVHPFAIKIKATTIDRVGRASGTLYALSVIAGVISMLLTQWYGIPHLGVNRLLFAIGMILLVTAVLGLIIDTRSKKNITGITSMMFLMTLAYPFVPNDGSDRSGTMIAAEESSYAGLRVIDVESERQLLVDGHLRARVDTSTWESELHYAGVMDLPKYFFDRQGTALIIGLGGGSIMKQYARDGWKVDVAEIDPEIIHFARTYFGVGPSDGTIIEADGRRYLSTTGTHYDVILIDAVNNVLPFHLVTTESFGVIESHLSDGGVLAVNIETTRWDDPFVKEIAVTLKQHFDAIVVFPIEEPPDTPGSMVLLASRRTLQPKRIPESNETFNPDWRYTSAYQKAHAWDNQFVPDLKHARILTDDLNPVDLHSEEVNLALHRQLQNTFERNGEHR